MDPTWNMDIYLRISILKNKIACDVIRARNLRLSDKVDISDPCVKIEVIKISEESKKYNKASFLSPRTRNVKGCPNPEWNEKLQLVFNGPKYHKLALLVQCWNSDKFEAEDLIGYHILPISSIINDPQESWFGLLPNDKLPNESCDVNKVAENDYETLAKITCQCKNVCLCYGDNHVQKEDDQTELDLSVGRPVQRSTSQQQSEVKYEENSLEGKEEYALKSFPYTNESLYDVYEDNNKEKLDYKEDNGSPVLLSKDSLNKERYTEYPIMIKKTDLDEESQEPATSVIFKNGSFPNVTIGVMQPIDIVTLPLGLHILRRGLEKINVLKKLKQSTNDTQGNGKKSKRQKFKDYLSNR